MKISKTTLVTMQIINWAPGDQEEGDFSLDKMEMNYFWNPNHTTIHSFTYY